VIFLDRRNGWIWQLLCTSRHGWRLQAPRHSTEDLTDVRRALDAEKGELAVKRTAMP
jgi:hypothetical protein